ncbi:electron transport complex subunit E [Candidatus Aerophobetes bacterium]|uniref:Ion-translocating oxidoreductase complex subunit E n=1 Tax=Aerophobetes bacterium TaxID=2030807 RepID=A0A7V5LZC4_UNCAE|nr:electron transport complex subunit E [Candidatus Aerophobetes bacterium]HHF97892.1 electron transport complex subunit E [Candidatus Aerophobetes bacterium]
MGTYRLYKEFFKGLWRQNPVFFQLLGMCPTLAVTNSAINGFSMGIAVIFVLTCSGIVVSSIRKLVPSEVRIPTFVIIIASFVTIIDFLFKAKLPEISKALGPYVPLIVVNCIILGRQEAFTSKNPLLPSIADTLGMGIGFTIALVILGSIREFFGSGSIFGYKILGDYFRPWVIMILPPGAFLTLGVLIGFINKFSPRRT